MAVFRVLASRTELFLIEAYVKAADRDDAETKFYAVLNDEGEALSWIQDFDTSDTEIDSIERLPAEHEVAPAPSDSSICLYCGRLVRWTGVSAAHSPTGRTIPGPWVHVHRPIVGEGIGL